MATTLGQANPFRYRGYYFDTESGLYYLQSRYYDPSTGRFINADDTAVLGLSELTGEVSGTNLFAYCYNDSVNMKDPDGHLPKWLNDFCRGFKDGFVGGASGLWNAFLNPLQTIKSIFNLKQFIQGWWSNLTVGWNIVWNIVKGNFYNAGKIYGGHIFQGLVVLITYGVGSRVSSALTTALHKLSFSKTVFQSASHLADHFNRHAAKLGFKTQRQYLNGARNLLSKRAGGSIQQFMSGDGWLFKYNSVTNEFVILSNKGTISTYFKPDNGIAYWNQQVKLYKP